MIPRIATSFLRLRLFSLGSKQMYRVERSALLCQKKVINCTRPQEKAQGSSLFLFPILTTPSLSKTAVKLQRRCVKGEARRIPSWGVAIPNCHILDEVAESTASDWCYCIQRW